jgi:hypothetical protein
MTYQLVPSQEGFSSMEMEGRMIEWMDVLTDT